MESFEYASYCGLYCGACDILNAFKKAKEQDREVREADLPEQFRQMYADRPVVCYGCTTDKVSEGCAGCEIRRCAREKNVETCILCGEYAVCAFVKQRKDRIATGLADRLPHAKAMFNSMDDVPKTGIDEWLRDQERKWSCPGCGEPFSWYQKKCGLCGFDVESVKDYKRF